MQHQTGKWTQESHPHSLNLGWTHWSLEQDLALEGHGPGQFRAREDSYLSVEQGPPSPTFPSMQYPADASIYFNYILKTMGRKQTKKLVMVVTFG